MKFSDDLYVNSTQTTQIPIQKNRRVILWMMASMESSDRRKSSEGERKKEVMSKEPNKLKWVNIYQLSLLLNCHCYSIGPVLR